jgi:methionine sulfoxide reductase heme-binding subunit
MGVLAVVHGSTYIIPHPEVILTRDFWITADGYPSYLAFGYLAMILTVPLLVTSSSWMMRHMGKYWKMLHRLVYIILIFSVAHVVLLRLYLHFEVAPVVLLVLYFIAKGFEWSGYSLGEKLMNKTYPKGQKWLCVPCGYIYDPAI